MFNGGQFCKSIAGDDLEGKSDELGTFCELPEEWLNRTADMDNIPNAFYVFPNGREKSFRTDAVGKRL